MARHRAGPEAANAIVLRPWFERTTVAPGRLAPSVLRHRLLLNYRSRADQITPEKIIADLLSAVPREAAR